MDCEYVYRYSKCTGGFMVLHATALGGVLCMYICESLCSLHARQEPRGNVDKPSTRRDLGRRLHQGMCSMFELYIGIELAKMAGHTRTLRVHATKSCVHFDIKACRRLADYSRRVRMHGEYHWIPCLL